MRIIHQGRSSRTSSPELRADGSPVHWPQAQLHHASHQSSAISTIRIPAAAYGATRINRRMAAGREQVGPRGRFGIPSLIDRGAMTGMPSAPQPSPAPLPRWAPPTSSRSLRRQPIRRGTRRRSATATRCDWRSRTGRRLLRMFATSSSGQRIWRGWSLHLTVLPSPRSGAPSRRPWPKRGRRLRDVQHQERAIAGPRPARSRLGRRERTPTSSHLGHRLHPLVGGTVSGPIVAGGGQPCPRGGSGPGCSSWCPGSWGPAHHRRRQDVTGRARPPRRSPCRPSKSARPFPRGTLQRDRPLAASRHTCC